ncbi:MAG: hypothetical protein BGP06_11605 [Rhizobiales bacterium 65-9]|nr:hypothetical protein [Hyphomicrobiales bacterium]OJY33942.1 MAG: hypothetical protein BGP06_11605 [Rhizobiales bacterium 65-9]
MIERFSSGRPWEERFKYSRAVMAGPFFQTCMTSPSDPAGGIMHPGDVGGQTRRCLTIIGETLAHADLSFSSIIASKIYLLDTRLWEEAGEVHAAMVGDARPALSFLGCANFWHPDILVEVEITAYDPRRTLAAIR